MTEEVKKPILITEEEYQEYCGSYCGICLACGEIRYGDTEPDAENYSCEDCGADRVQGIENSLMEGNIAFTGGEDDD